MTLKLEKSEWGDDVIASIPVTGGEIVARIPMEIFPNCQGDPKRFYDLCLGILHGRFDPSLNGKAAERGIQINFNVEKLKCPPS